MNKQIIIAFLVAAVLILSYKYYKELQTNNTKLDMKEAVIQTIHNRKSVRRFTEKKVSKEDLQTIMKAGMAAPSGHDKRPWVFIAITDRSIMEELHKELPWASGLKESTAAIVVCGDIDKVDSRNPEFWITDTSAATQNMLLTIESMGLGGVWCTLFPGEDRMQYARDVLNLPQNMMPMCVIPIGYPQGIEKAKDKYDASLIHWEKW